MNQARSAPLVYITGASSGIGQALALRFYRAGWWPAPVARASAGSRGRAPDEPSETGRAAG